MRSRLAPAGAALLASAALLGGCVVGTGGSGTEGGGGQDGGGVDGGGQDGSGGGDPPTEIDPGLLECGDPTGKEDELQLADLDLETATWSTPPGFVLTDGYSEDNPVEEVRSTWYAELDDPRLPRLNVIQVVVYTGLDWGDAADSCGRVPLSAVEDRLAGYREQIGAEPLGEAEMTTVAGQPAITQDIALARYSYEGYWLFSPTQLLHVYCQWTDASHESRIRAGCGPLVDSVRIG